MTGWGRRLHSLDGCRWGHKGLWYADDLPTQPKTYVTEGQKRMYSCFILARSLLHALSHRQNNTWHSLWRISQWHWREQVSYTHISSKLSKQAEWRWAEPPTFSLLTRTRQHWTISPTSNLDGVPIFVQKLQRDADCNIMWMKIRNSPP